MFRKRNVKRIVKKETRVRTRVEKVSDRPVRKKVSRWIHTRHYFVRNFFAPFFWIWSRLVYNIRIEKFKDAKKRGHLVLFNHQTSFDQFFVGLAFSVPVYYVASEDLFSNGFVSKLLQYYLAPIPINKSAADLRAVINCMKVASEGGTLALAPEGNRTYSGRTVHIKPSIAALVRKLKLPVAFFRIEGGYGVQPRWSDVNRRGRMKAGVSRVLEPDEYLAMTDEELYSVICSELYVDEARVTGKFTHRKRAEYLERVIYICPECGLSEFESSGCRLSCKKCGLTAEYLPTKELSFIKGSADFRFVADWYDWQEEYINSIDPADFGEKPVYTDHARVSLVVVARYKKKLCDRAEIRLYGNLIEINCSPAEKLVFDFGGGGSVTALGRNKMNLRFGGNIYQIKGNSRFNPVKYMNLFYRYRNLHVGGNSQNDSEFLGL